MAGLEEGLGKDTKTCQPPTERNPHKKGATSSISFQKTQEIGTR